MAFYPGDGQAAGQRSGCCVAYRRSRARLIAAAGVAAAGGLRLAHQPSSLLSASRSQGMSATDLLTVGRSLLLLTVHGPTIVLVASDDLSEAEQSLWEHFPVASGPHPHWQPR